MAAVMRLAHAAQALVHHLSVAKLAPCRNLGAARGGVPSLVCPFNCSRHAVLQIAAFNLTGSMACVDYPALVLGALPLVTFPALPSGIVTGGVSPVKVEAPALLPEML